ALLARVDRLSPPEHVDPLPTEQALLVREQVERTADVGVDARVVREADVLEDRLAPRPRQAVEVVGLLREVDLVREVAEVVESEAGVAGDGVDRRLRKAVREVEEDLAGVLARAHDRERRGLVRPEAADAVQERARVEDARAE